MEWQWKKFINSGEEDDLMQAARLWTQSNKKEGEGRDDITFHKFTVVVVCGCLYDNLLIIMQKR